MKTYAVEIYDADEISAVEGIAAPGARAAAVEACGTTPLHAMAGCTFRVWEVGGSTELWFEMSDTGILHQCQALPAHEVSL